MRSRQFTILGVVAFLIICFYSFSHIERTPYLGPSADGKTASDPAAPASPETPATPPVSPEKSLPRPAEVDSGHQVPASMPNVLPPSSKPKKASRTSHPMWSLISGAESGLEKMKARQSKTLKEAVAEYRKRYGIAPPPHFDKWFAFAKENDVVLVDEFDTIHDLLMPFWGLKPATIRARAKEALGFGNGLLGLSIRDGNISHMEGGGDWQRDATKGMLRQFIQYLPNMDLCFNVHDEPRVVVPHEDMVRLIATARDKTMAKARANADSPGTLRNKFTAKVKGLSSGSRFEEAALTRFNVFAHQPTWTHSRMSCPPNSPARALEEEERRDDVSQYSLGELGFVYNTTALSDICYTPSLSETFGFFDRPNAYNIVHDLFPIFSQSKVSSYADILYPSPWYWYEKVSYDEARDKPWADKIDQLYWRGSTTGGFSRDGGWRRQHRQRFVQKINAADQAKILKNEAADHDGGEQDWQVKDVARADFKDLFNVYFSHIGQCDEGDCEAQKEFFMIQDRADQQDAWQYKYLVDLDGNAFSGRFYAFLRSKSLIYKQAIFREWHYEWIKPWAHYIPLSLRGDDWLETVRFFGDGALGKNEAERLAIQSRDWANKVVRNVDLEAWFFRLLLEYGRVVDDDRESIGFTA